ncbi:Uu.00g064940.m01.CDS01 [Anthostomella pinea]|uniref:Uu.00g064940.m01.CDS01 n=1 Tax=Anthostomella pinea TaxID=933095 RepID=A0AAI8VTQ2_9PEZI|nr:Uu.00g064940.m01.CDS01 [Anthostomella pinea]
MAPVTDSSVRSGKLSRFFRDVLRGNRTIITRDDSQLFLEAVRNQESPAICVESLIASPCGLTAVRHSVRADLSLPFMKSQTLGFLAFLSRPEVKTLANGQLLEKVLQAIVIPATFWNELLKGFLEYQLEEEAILQTGWLSQAKAHETRDLAYKIEKVLQLKTLPQQNNSSYSPGGRHDNDFADFRQIATYPTADEFLAIDRPFYRRAEEIFESEPAERSALHLDNQYRLLREDMLGELRQDLQVAIGRKKGRRSALTLESLTPVKMELGDDNRGRQCSLAVECLKGLERLRKVDKNRRRQFLLDNQNYLKHQAFGALFNGETICGFAFVNRDLDLLARDPPVVCLQFTESKALGNALLSLKSPRGVQFILVDTPVFAYAPILNELKAMNSLPLHDVLLHPSQKNIDVEAFEPPERIRKLASALSSKPVPEQGVGSKDSTVRMDQSQVDSFVNALTNPVSIIQGPPGTGKTVLGSQTVKCMQRFSALRILVISYTNHALDQFLEDLLDVGIPAEHMVRLGSKSTARTVSMLLPRHTHHLKRSAESWATINQLKADQAELSERIHFAFGDYLNLNPSFQEILEHLEFSQSGRRFFNAFRLPAAEQEWRRVARKGKEVKKDYLFSQWRAGNGPGMFANNVSKDLESVWDMPAAIRHEQLAGWVRAVIQERAQIVEDLSEEFNRNQERLDDLFSEGKVGFVRSKRVIGCTTTAAAMQQKLIRASRPDVVLVEEAGEILESHVLTALAPTVKQLILIGDHKQLRPKVNNYALTVEKGDGYDLNMSLFERMIRQGYKHTTLRKQHRMEPQISLFPRALTYPDLLDGPKTEGRPTIDGLQDRVVFINHEHPETQLDTIADRLDPGMKASKENAFEAVMVLRIVRYLAQQGYGTDSMVVLTPYLGQLRLLRQKLAEENDPILNDPDASELIQAGLMTQAASKVNKRPLRISTIDNYQGEESDIVIVSLTRGNAKGDIGFMAAPERLNVLITRARNCLVMIGNMDTFMRSRGKDTWYPFFELLKEHSHLYDGLPVKCERHPNRTAVIQTPEDFDQACPDGGCAEPCGVMLKCGLHKCKHRCHRVNDHSQAECTHIVERVCDRQHKRRLACSKKDESCRKCIDEDKNMERRAKRDLEMERERSARQQAYLQELQHIQDEQEHERRHMRYLTEQETQKKSIAQQREDLKMLKETASRMAKLKLAQTSATNKTPPAPAEGKTSSPDSVPGVPSDVQKEWEYLKEFEGARSDPLDELMGMIGLEEVKEQFLQIKNTVDTKLRQNVSLASERFSCSLLGNPGTGKTTVARLYAKFLTSIGVLPGSHLEETTGSKLANLGVSGCQKLIDSVLNEGGGVIFIDEAYQLTSGNSHGGAGVLDYLLPEVENLTGKIVFVLAGYNKQMESFFSHNPGLPSRFPIEMGFADHTDDELLRILGLKISKQYKGSMKCEDGLQGLYCRIVSRRIGRGRGREGFGDARTVENTLARITLSQAKRLTGQRRQGLKPDDLLLTKEDLIGPKPSEVLGKSEGWRRLLKLIGLSSVKQAVKSLVDSVEQNYHRELAEQPPIEYSLNKVFIGNPGTGKTTVAKLYGQILVDLGLLSKGEVVVRNPSDFVGSALGQSEQQTKGILASTTGKVLVIDEAYGLYGSGSGSGQGSMTDPYKTAVIDTIVAEVQSVPGDDRCVLVLGYKEQMETMFQNVNPGLSRRFPIASAFEFADFSNEELRQILDLKLKQQAFEATDQAKNVAMEILDRGRNRPNFGNAGDIDNLLDTTKARHQSRFSRGQTKSAATLEAIDFDENFDRAERSETNVQTLFEGTVGSVDIVARLTGYQETVRTMKALDMDPRENIPFNFLFRGPPGTGKTTTARKMGKVFYDMGFLADGKVIECSATDLIGQYVGQTGPKVQQLLDKALGKVLFVDEAYRLADGGFATEAVNELVDSVTKERYHKKLIIILAGYEKDINRLMSINEGLTSRFPEVVNFRGLSPPECFTLLTKQFASRRPKLELKGISLDLTAVESPSLDFAQQVARLFSGLSKQSSWASARDVQTLGKAIFNDMLKDRAALTSKKLVLQEGVVISHLQKLFDERESRSRSGAAAFTPQTGAMDCASGTQAVPRSTFNTSTKPETERPAEPEHHSEPEPQAATKDKDKDKQGSTQPHGHHGAQRDAGVSDAVWAQLQRDRQAEQERENEYQRLLEAKDRAKEAERERIVRKLLEEERRRKEEAEMQIRLAQMGVCPMGFSWIKQAAGYRCAGGSHFMSKPGLLATDDGTEKSRPSLETQRVSARHVPNVEVNARFSIQSLDFLSCSVTILQDAAIDPAHTLQVRTSNLARGCKSSDHVAQMFNVTSPMMRCKITEQPRPSDCELP